MGSRANYHVCVRNVVMRVHLHFGNGGEMKARVILHEDGITKFVQTLEMDGLMMSQNGGITLFTPDNRMVMFDSSDWNKLEIDK